MKHLFLVIIILVSINSYSQDGATTAKKFSSPTALNLRDIYKMIEYPDSARENGIEGKVVIRILVNEDGYVIGDKGLMEGNLVFYTEVKRCVYKLKFTPAKMNGLPTKCYINIPFNFTLIHKDKEEE